MVVAATLVLVFGTKNLSRRERVRWNDEDEDAAEEEATTFGLKDLYPAQERSRAPSV